MANAELEKLNLLREYRSSQESFYYHLTLLCGGTISLFVTVINMQTTIVVNYSSYQKFFLMGSVIALIVSLFLSVYRNLRSFSMIKQVTVEATQTEYNQIIATFSKDDSGIVVLSFFALMLYLVGTVVFAFVTLPPVLNL